MSTELAGEAHDSTPPTEERRLKAGVVSKPFCVKERIPPQRPKRKN